MSSGWGRVLALVFAVGVLAACDSGMKTAGIDASGVRTPVVTQGPIQGFGSIIINGRHYALTNAQISVNGQPASEQDLAVGQLVTVAGSVDESGADGEADTVEFDSNVEGPVQAVDAAAGTLVVLGQAVSTQTDTVLDLGAAGADLTALAVGDFVSVSGLVTPGGTIVATWIEREDTAGEMRVIGTVSSLDTALFRFKLNDLVVDYSGVTMLEGFAGGAPSDGDRVRVQGTALGADGELIATDVTLLPRRFSEREGDQAEVEGLITRFVSPADFDVSGLPVTASASTLYEGGSASSLQLDVKIQVEGSVDADGVIVASKIEVKDGGVVVDE